MQKNDEFLDRKLAANHGGKWRGQSLAANSPKVCKLKGCKLKGCKLKAAN